VVKEADPAKVNRDARRLAFNVIVTQALLWGLFLNASGRGNALPLSLVVIMVLLVAWNGFWALLQVRATKRFTFVTMASLMNIVSLIFTDFSILYWLCGTNGNFTSTLSRLDAVYFALGTMTTAGTGSIAPDSQLARGLVSAQMAVDFVFLATVVSVAITRFAERT
jgi:voltage-gated potassium channel